MPRGYPGTGPTARAKPIPPAPRTAPSRAPVLQAKVEDARLAQIRRQMDELVAQAARIEAEVEAQSRYGEDDFEEGAVVTWTQTYPGRGTRYSYAAIKAADTWWVTGRAGRAQLTWSELVRRHLSGSTDAAHVDTVVPL